MTEIFICLLSGIFSIAGLYVGSHLNKRNSDSDRIIVEKRFEIYKPIYFALCVDNYKPENIKQTISNTYDKIKTNNDNYLLMDSKTRERLITINNNMAEWNPKALARNVNKLRKSVEKQFIQMQHYLGYPVSKTKHFLTNASFGLSATSFSGFFMINDFIVLVNRDTTLVAIFILSLSAIFLLSITYFMTHIHYLWNY